VEEECIFNLMANKQCKLPVQLALFVTSNANATIVVDHNHPSARIAWVIEEKPGKDFWLFKRGSISPDVIAMKRSYGWRRAYK
jgi:hypothetical protein